MTTSPYLSLILPAYNEVKSIGRTLTAMQAYLDKNGFRYEILVSADGNDGTREVVAERAATDARIRVLGSAERGGKGKGIRNAVAIANGDWVGYLDADYKVVIDEIEKLLPAMHAGYDIVFGSRGVGASRIVKKQPLVRRVGSKAFRFGMHVFTGLWGIQDTQCGFKFFRAPIARDLFARQRIDGYMFDVEILYLAKAAGYTMNEIGVRWADDGDSRLQLVAGNWRNFKDILRIRFGRKNLTPIAAETTPLRTAA